MLEAVLACYRKIGRRTLDEHGRQIHRAAFDFDPVLDIGEADVAQLFGAYVGTQCLQHLKILEAAID